MLQFQVHYLLIFITYSKLWTLVLSSESCNGCECKPINLKFTCDCAPQTDIPVCTGYLITLPVSNETVLVPINTTLSTIEVIKLKNLNIQLLNSIFQNVHLPILNHLEFDNCHITYINNEAFEPLQNIVHLSISNNKNIYLNDDTFSYLKNVETLVLENNAIERFPMKIFQHMNRLSSLHLDNNHITTIPADLFQNLINLKTLTLNKNLIKDLEPDFLHNLNNIIYISLLNNPLNCNCHMLKFFDEYKRRNNFILISTCREPSFLNNKEFRILKRQDFWCPVIVKNIFVSSENETFKLDCIVSSKNDVNITWELNNTVLNTYQFTLPNTTRINNDEYSSVVEFMVSNLNNFKGIFSCIAFNNYEFDNKTYEIFIETKKMETTTELLEEEVTDVNTILYTDGSPETIQEENVITNIIHEELSGNAITDVTSIYENQANILNCHIQMIRIIDINLDEKIIKFAENDDKVEDYICETSKNMSHRENIQIVIIDSDNQNSTFLLYNDAETSNDVTSVNILLNECTGNVHKYKNLTGENKIYYCTIKREIFASQIFVGIIFIILILPLFIVCCCIYFICKRCDKNELNNEKGPSAIISDQKNGNSSNSNNEFDALLNDNNGISLENIPTEDLQPDYTISNESSEPNSSNYQDKLITGSNSEIQNSSSYQNIDIFINASNSENSYENIPLSDLVQQKYSDLENNNIVKLEDTKDNEEVKNAHENNFLNKDNLQESINDDRFVEQETTKSQVTEDLSKTTADDASNNKNFTPEIIAVQINTVHKQNNDDSTPQKSKLSTVTTSALISSNTSIIFDSSSEELRNTHASISSHKVTHYRTTSETRMGYHDIQSSRSVTSNSIGYSTEEVIYENNSLE